MFRIGISGPVGLVAAVLLGGCVAETPVSVAPGQGKSLTDLQRDDAACRPAAPAVASTTTTAPAATPASAGDYYQCMAAKGELVVTNRSAAYPVYAGYPYYAYLYGYPYPYGYPFYGYPYPAAYYGPFLGVGFGFGGGFYRGYGGFYRGGFYRGGDFHGGSFRGGDFHGGDFHGGGGFHR